VDKLIRHFWHAGHGPFHGAEPGVIAAAIVLGLLLAVGYLVSLRLNPYTTCHKCHGTGRVRGIFFSWARDFCPKCDGYGIVPRLGTFLLSAQNRPQVPGGAVR
jgi:hypothetical protein